MSELTLEQQFELAKARAMIGEASDQELRDLFLELYEMMLHKDNVVRDLLAQQWGFDCD